MMRASRLLTALLLFAVARTGSGEAQETHLQTFDGRFGQVIVEVDSTAIYFADPLRVRYQVEALTGTAVTLPTVTETLGPFRVVERQASGPVSTADDMVLRRREFVLEANEAGTLFVPSLTFIFEGEEGGPSQILTEPISVLVTAIVPDSADLTEPRDIAQPLRAEFVPPSTDPSYGWVWWALAVALFIASLTVVLRRMLWRARPLGEDDRFTSHHIAQTALDRLRRRNLLEQDQFDAFYVILSGILRWYLEHRFEMKAPYRTTEETAAQARSNAPVSDHANWLVAVLRQSDAVKFARRQPTRDEATEMLEAIDRFVADTADNTVLTHAPPPLGA